MAFNRRETAILLIGDFLILVISLWIALALRNLSLPSIGYLQTNLVPFLPVFVISLVVFYISGLYEKQTRPIRRVMGVRIFGAQVANVCVAAILFFVLPLNIAPKTILALYLVVSVVAESAWRFRRMRHEIKESEREPAVLYGSGSAVQELYEEINNNGRYLIKFVAHKSAVAPDESGKSDIKTAISNGVRTVVVDTSDPMIAGQMPLLYEIVGGRANIVAFSSLYEEIFDRVPLSHLDATQLLNTLPKHRGIYDISKRVFDIVLAIVASCIAIPIVACATAVLIITGGNPFIFSERIGRGGRSIYVIKLRSMLFNDRGDPELQKKNRITKFGKFLRTTRIDELPQLWNVLKGDLSFIGPRPELPKIAETYEKEIPQYRMRHLIAPGLSGWAQIHDYDAPRGGADVERTRRKLSLDLYYLKHRSFGLDLAIAVKTLRALAAFTGT